MNIVLVFSFQLNRGEFFHFNRGKLKINKTNVGNKSEEEKQITKELCIPKPKHGSKSLTIGVREWRDGSVGVWSGGEN